MVITILYALFLIARIIISHYSGSPDNNVVFMSPLVLLFASAAWRMRQSAKKARDETQDCDKIAEKVKVKEDVAGSVEEFAAEFVSKARGSFAP